jgi:antitoxin component YwqK of YwqJK toxin-antitoxin module
MIVEHKAYFLFLIVLIYSCCYSSKDNYVNRNWRVFYYSNGIPKDSIEYSQVNLLVDGDWKTYYPSGGIMRWQDYICGVKHGKDITYSMTGVEVYFCEYRYGIKHGYEGHCYRNGKIKTLDSFYKGSKIGETFCFDSSGFILTYGSVKNLSAFN